MNGIYQHYTIDLSSNNNFVQIPTVQGDGNSIRGLEIELIQNGVPYEIDKDDTLIFVMGTKQDANEVMNNCLLTDDGYILVDITSQMSAVKGRGDYQIVLMSRSANTQLKSFPFQIITTPAAFDAGYITSSDEFQTLATNIKRTEEVVKEANDAITGMRNLEESVEEAETSRASEEDKRANAERGRVSAENVRVSNENGRQSSEINRQNAETNRADAEADREEAEKSRASTENARITNENTRQTNEDSRKAGEAKRVNAETGRISAESGRVNAENTRASNENSRNTAEDARRTAETARSGAETARSSNETARQNNESARQSSEAARQTDTALAISNANNAAARANNAAKTCENLTSNNVFGDKDISSIGDGTLTGAIAALSADLGGLELVTMTQAEYEALEAYDANTLYITT